MYNYPYLSLKYSSIIARIRDGEGDCVSVRTQDIAEGRSVRKLRHWVCVKALSVCDGSVRYRWTLNKWWNLTTWWYLWAELWYTQRDLMRKIPSVELTGGSHVKVCQQDGKTVSEKWWRGWERSSVTWCVFTGWWPCWIKNKKERKICIHLWISCFSESLMCKWTTREFKVYSWLVCYIYIYIYFIYGLIILHLLHNRIRRKGEELS